MGRLKKIIFYSVSIFLLSANISAYTWQNAVIMGGGFVSGLAYSPVQQDLLYARTDVGGLYRWNNSASRWVPLTDMSAGSFMGGESIAPDPVDPNVVYAAVGFSGYGNILRSSNQGTSWTVYPVPVSMAANNDGRQAGERLAVDPNLPSKIYFGSRWQGLWLSTNSGAAWSHVPAFPANGDTGYGISWVIFPRPAGGYGNPSGTASQTIYAGVMSLSSGNSNIYRSTNGGTTWSLISGGPSSMMTPHASLGTDGYLWIVYGGGGYGPSGISSGQVWKLNTSTLAWTNVTPAIGPAAGSGGYGDVCVDAQNPQHAILSTMDWWGGPDKVFQTINGGTSWTIISSHNVGWNAGPFSVFDLNGAVWGYGCGGNAGGAGWAGNAKIDPFNSNKAIYTSGSGPGGGGVWSSSSINAASQPAGVTWVFSDNGLEETVSIYMPTSVKNGILFSCLGDIGGMRHTDLTQSPASGINCNPQFSNTNCLDFAENNTNIVVRVGNANSSTNNDVAYSSNNGQTWTPWGSSPPGYTTNNQMGSVAVAADGSSVVVAPYGGNGSPAYASTLGGAWTTCAGLPSGAWVASDRVTASTFYATSPSTWVFGGTVNIYRSTDYGHTFTQINSISVNWSDPNGNGQFVVPRPVFGMPGEFWVSTYDLLYRFTNGGATVTTIPNVYHPMGPVGFGKAAPSQAHPAVYLVGTVNGTYGFFRCDDGTGAAWTRMNDDNHQFGGPGWIQGDQQIYGRCYLAAGARGIIYGDMDAVTPTNTPVNTMTFTRTFTFTPSATATRTSTLTMTRTFTAISSPTYTGTPTSTATRTNTAAYTFTTTPSSTVTVINTATYTATPSATATISVPTPSFTQTASFTSTRTYSATYTLTATPSQTSSPDHSPTLTSTGTPPTPANTPTITVTSINTATTTPTNTYTRTNTFTATNTPVNTSTSSAVPTATVTPVNTFTNTVVPTASRTSVSTATSTQIPPATMTFTRTFTRTATPTASRTVTAVLTATFTATCTVTQTMTNTQVNTPTFTPTPANTPDKFEIKDALVYPNPYAAAQPLSIVFYASQASESLTLKIYSVSFRLLLKENLGTCPGGWATKQIPSIYFDRFANGTYYYVVTGTNQSGKSAVSKIQELIIIR